MDCIGIENIAKIFFYLAAPSAAWVALFTWKRELKGKSKHEVAKQILGLVIQVRVNIKSAQFQAIGVRSSKNKLACYEWVNKCQFKAIELATEVEIHWGTDEEPLKNLCIQLFELSFVAQSYEPYNHEFEEESIKSLKEYQEILV